MIKQLKISAQTDVGRRRDHNEDNLAFVFDSDINTAERHFPILKAIKTGYAELSLENIQKKGLLMILADGMGGEQAGEVASELAVDFIIKRITGETLIPDFFGVINRSAWNEFLRRMNNYIILANKFIYEYSLNSPESKGMGTTIVTAEVTLHDDLCLHWVGDSRAYLYRHGEGLSVLTKDHSVVQELVDKGKINEDMAFFHPDKNIITQSLGDKDPVKPGSKLIELFDGDRILLCSDGLNDMLQHHEIEEILSNIDDTDECAKLLVNKANEAGGNDNISVILCDVESSKINTAKAKEKLRTADTMPVSTYKTNDSFTRDNYNNLKIKIRNRNIILSILLLLVVSIGGYFGYDNIFPPKQKPNKTDSTTANIDTTGKVPTGNVDIGNNVEQIETNNNSVNSLTTKEIDETNSAINETKKSQLANGVNNDSKIFYVKLIGLKDASDICNRYDALKISVSNLVLFQEGDIYILASGPMKLDEAKGSLDGINSKIKTILNKTTRETDILQKNNLKTINFNDFCSSVNKVTEINTSESNLTKVQKYQVFIIVEPEKADSLLTLIRIIYPIAILNSNSTKIIIDKDLSEIAAKSFIEKTPKIQNKDVKQGVMEK